MGKPPKKVSASDFFDAGARYVRENPKEGAGSAVNAGLNFGTLGLAEPMQAQMFLMQHKLPQSRYNDALQFVKGMHSEGFKQHPYVGTAIGIGSSAIGGKGLQAGAELVGQGIRGTKYAVTAATKGKQVANAQKAANAAKTAKKAADAEKAYNASGKVGKFTKNVAAATKKDIIPMTTVGAASGALNTPKNPVKGALIGGAGAAAATPVGATAGQVISDTLKPALGAVRQLALRNNPNFDKLSPYDKTQVIASVLKTAPKEMTKAYNDMISRLGTKDPVAVAGSFDAHTSANFKKEIGLRSNKAPDISNKNISAERNKIPTRMNKAVRESMQETNKSAGDTVANLREQNNRAAGAFKETYGDKPSYIRTPDKKQRYDIKGKVTNTGDNIAGRDVATSLNSSIERHPSDLGRNSRYLKNNEENIYNRDWSSIDEQIYNNPEKYSGLPLMDARAAYMAENGLNVTMLPLEAHAGRIGDFDNLRQSMRPNNLLKDTQKKNMNTAANYLVENMRSPDQNITAEAWRNMLKNFGQTEQRISGVEYGRNLKNPDLLRRIQDINDLSSPHGRQGISEGVVQGLFEDSTNIANASKLMKEAANRHGEFRPNTLSYDPVTGIPLKTNSEEEINAYLRQSLGLPQRSENAALGGTRNVGEYTGGNGYPERPTMDPQNPNIIDAQFQDVNTNPFNDQGYVPRFVGEDFTQNLSDKASNWNQYYDNLKQIHPSSIKPNAEMSGDQQGANALLYQAGGASQTGFLSQLINFIRSKSGMNESAAKEVADLFTNPARADEAIAILNAPRPLSKITGQPTGTIRDYLFKDHPITRFMMQSIARDNNAQQNQEVDPRLEDLSNQDAVQSYMDSSKEPPLEPPPGPPPPVRVVPYGSPDKPSEPAKKDPYAPVTNIDDITDIPNSPQDWQDNESWDQWQARIKSGQ